MTEKATSRKSKGIDLTEALNFKLGCEPGEKKESQAKPEEEALRCIARLIARRAIADGLKTSAESGNESNEVA